MDQRNLPVAALVIACPLLLGIDGSRPLIDRHYAQATATDGSGGNSDTEARLRYMGEIDKRLAERIDQMPREIQGQVAGLERLVEEKFRRFDMQITALAANDARNEANVSRQLDTINSLLSSNSRSVTDVRLLIDELKTATATINARSEGQNQLWSYLVAGAGILIAFLSFILPRFSNLQKPPPPPSRSR